MIRPIKMKGNPFDDKAHRRAIKAALDTEAALVLLDFEKTTATWNSAPGFDVTDNGEFERVVGTDDEKYEWADDGTKAHDIGPIVPKTKKAITIRGKGTPKTTPRVIGSASGSRGAVIVVRKSTKVIHHPGTKARAFAETIAEKAGEDLAAQMQVALNGVAG